MKRTLIVGYFGQGNAGDDAFVDVAGWGLSRFHPEHKFKGTLIGSLRVPSCTLHGIYHRCFEKIWFYMETSRLSHILFVGGSNFHSSPAMEQWLEVSGRNPRCHFAGIGVSIGPFRDKKAERLCRELLGRFSYLGVRDLQSYVRLQEMGVSCHYEVTFDLAVQERVIHKLYSPDRLRAHKILGVSLCYYERYTGKDRRAEEDRLMLAASLIKNSLRNGIFDSVILFSFNQHPVLGDNEILGRLRALVGDKDYRIHVRPYDGNPVALMKAVGQVDMMIAMRLHAAVFSYAMKVPCLVLPYHEKCWEWTRMIREKRVLDTSEASADAAISIMMDVYHGGDVGLLPVSSAVAMSESNWTGLATYF